MFETILNIANMDGKEIDVLIKELEKEPDLELPVDKYVEWVKKKKKK